MTRRSAAELIALVVDEGSWVSWDVPPQYDDITEKYREDLAAAREKSGLDESVTSGRGRVGGRDVAIVACDFGFLAGSIGRASAQRLVDGIRRATEERLPLLATTSSGGTRMQEGTPAFLMMLKIAKAVADHRQAGLPYLTYLRHPTTGGVMASWGSLGQVTVAEPGALVGFLGPRVYEAIYGEDFPDVQRSENLYDKGVIDAVVEHEELADIVSRCLGIIQCQPVVPPEPQLAVINPTDAWDSITRSRDPRRPGVRRFLREAATDVLLCSGTGRGEIDPGMLLALARFESASCVVLGQDRRAQDDEPMGPGALRVAQRGMRLAVELGLPLMTVVDTPGAALSAAAEEGAMAGEIARCLADLSTLQAPTLCFMLGQGNGGGALALLPADRVIAAEHAWLSPLPPEGASAIVHRSTDQAPAMARAQQVRSVDLREAGIVDVIVPESPDAAHDPSEFCQRAGEVVSYELARLATTDLDQLRQLRSDKISAL